MMPAHVFNDWMASRCITPRKQTSSQTAGNNAMTTRFSNIISFEMQCNEELEWKIIDPYPPQWAFVLEEQIGKMIGGR